jgi:hypothetical protein
MVDSIIDDPALNGNAYVLVMILMFMLNDAGSCDQISGFGSMGKFFSDRTDDMSEIIEFWKKQDLTNPNAGMDFMKMLEDLKFKVENSPYATGIKDAFKTQLEAIEHLTGAHHASEWLIDEYNKALSGDADAKADVNDTYTQIINNSKDPDAPIPPGFETIDYTLKSLSTRFTDESQTQTTMLTKLTNDSQANLNMINKSLNGDTGIVGLLNQLIRNQKGQ